MFFEMLHLNYSKLKIQSYLHATIVYLLWIVIPTNFTWGCPTPTLCLLWSAGYELISTNAKATHFLSALLIKTRILTNIN